MSVSDNLLENFRFLSLQAESALEHWQHLLINEAGDWSARYAGVLHQRIEQACIAGYRDANNTESRQLHLYQSLANDLLRLCHLPTDLPAVSDLDKSYRKLSTRLLRQASDGIAALDHVLESNRDEDLPNWQTLQTSLERLNTELHPANDHKWSDEPRASSALWLHRERITQLVKLVQNMGQAISASALNKDTQMRHLRKLNRRLRKLEPTTNSLRMNEIAQTRSGNTVSGISHDEKYLAVLKQGLKRKLKQERAGIERWNSIFPGLTPQVLSWDKDGESAALLIEHMPGLTWEQLLMRESSSLQQEALQALSTTLKRCWRKTREDKAPQADFMGQLLRRLPQVLQLHPEYRPSTQNLGGLRLASLSTLIEQASEREAQLHAPYRVLIHGDFNVDNILYDPDGQRIRFIDLHRSRSMDPVQDISVLLVSHYRLPILDPARRAQALRLAQQFYEFARRFARKSEDQHFEDRMGLALARSFITSTRFTLDKRLARNMFLRGRYLIERILEAQPGQYKLPIEELFHA